MYKETTQYVEQYLSMYLFGFRRSHNTEQCFLVMLEISKKHLIIKK